MLLLVGGVLFGAPQSLVEAAELNFSVKAILPENQIDKKQNYFDLRVKPGEKQTIEVEVTNSGDEEIEVDMYLAAASTNIKGVISYPDPKSEDFKYDDTLKYPLPEIAKMPESVKVPAKSSVKVPIELSVPEEEFKGMIVGGIQFMKKEDESDSEEQGGGMGVRNKFMYRIGLKLTEEDDAVETDMKLLGVHAGQVSYRNVIYANLQNTEPAVMEDLSVEAKVYPKGSKNLLYQQKTSDMRMAPNSNFEFPISIGNKAFKAGKYTLHLVATAADDKRWEFTKDFEITSDEAKKYNEESAVELEYEPNLWLWIGIGIGVVLLLIILIVVFVVVAKKRKKARRKAARNKREMRKNGQSSQSNSNGASANSKKKRKKSNGS